MKDVARIKKRYVYLILIITLAITWVINNCVTFSLTPESLRILATVVATTTGILCGLVAATAALIVQVAISQKQFPQRLLVSVSQWLKDWLNTHSTIPGLDNRKVKHLLYLLDRYSTIAAVSDKDVLELASKVLLPLPKKWFRMISRTPEQIPLQKEEIEEFKNHVDQIEATVRQIEASKARLGVAKSLGDFLWLLVGTLIFAIILIILTTIPAGGVIASFIAEKAAPLAFTLLEIVVILTGGITYVIARYLKAEHIEATRIVER